MKIIGEYLNGLKVIQLDVHKDDRGSFTEIFSYDALKDIGIDFTPVQDNEAVSLKRGTVRGLHFQKGEYAQAKLVRCVSGSFWNLAADIRRGSPTFGEISRILLKKGDGLLVYVPKGFAHGTAVIEDGTEYTYKVDRPYAVKKEDRGGLSVFYDRSRLDLESLFAGCELILSDKDRYDAYQSPDELGDMFVYAGEEQ